MKNLKNTSSIYNMLTLKNLASYLKSFGILKFGEMPMYKSLLEKFLIDIFCSKYMNVCEKFFQHFTDSLTDSLDVEQINQFLSRVPARTSIASLEHWTQYIQIENDEIYGFDHGPEINFLKYGQTTPKIYSLENIDLNLMVIYGERDILCSSQNIRLL